MKADLVVLVADRHIEAAVKGLITRTSSLGIRELAFDTFTHQGRDPGCLNQGVEFLSGMERRYEHALLMFDHEGCGQDEIAVSELQERIAAGFRNSAWGDRAKVVIIDPELEAWVWSRSANVASILGWSNRKELDDWLVANSWIDEYGAKPSPPKEAMAAALQEKRVPKSASLFRQLAERVSLR